MEMITTKVQDRKGYITLNRPEKRNALHHQLITELKQVFHDWQRNDDVKVIVLQAIGPAFTAGADLAYLNELSEYSFKENYADSIHLKELLDLMYRYPKVIIAKVQGHAIAGGCGLMGVCDFAITVPEAKFGYTEVRIGFLPALVSIYLRKKIGEAWARTILLRGSLISAEEAHRIGLVYQVVPEGELTARTEALAEELIQLNSAHSMAAVKEMLVHIQDIPYEEALEYAAEMNAKARESVDCRIGLKKFLAKEEIRW